MTHGQNKRMLESFHSFNNRFITNREHVEYTSFLLLIKKNYFEKTEQTLGGNNNE